MTLYEQLLGPRYRELPLAVQRFHRLAGRHVLHGRVRTRSPATLLSRLLALCLGTPRSDGEGPIRFELEADTGQERWTRVFPAQTMRSVLSPDRGLVLERLGLSRLSFELAPGAQGQLSMRLVRLRFLGLACPRWLMPRITADEFGEGPDVLRFEISASVPWIGRVAAYSGHLKLPESEAP